MSGENLARVIEMLKAAPFTSDQPVDVARAAFDGFGDLFAVPEGVTVEPMTLGGVPGETLTANAGGPVVLYLHGGGYVIGSPKSHRHVGALLAREIACTVHVLDYRMGPEDPFPAALDDAVAAWADLASRHDPARCALAGDSAGGGLCFTALVAARDRGLPMPGCIVAISPWVNLTTESASYDRLAGVDPMISRNVVEYFAPRYAGSADRRDPRLSALFADVRGLPPTLVQIGDRECFFGDAAAMHEVLLAAGVESRFAPWAGMFHVWHLYWPMLDEGRAAIVEGADFVKAHCTPG